MKARRFGKRPFGVVSVESLGDVRRIGAAVADVVRRRREARLSKAKIIIGSDLDTESYTGAGGCR